MFEGNLSGKLNKILIQLFFVAGILLGSLFFSSEVSAATLSISPATGNYTTQNNFTVSVEVNTNQAINGVEGVISFPTNKLEVIGFDKSRSIMSLWVQEPSFSNSGQIGMIQFSVVKLNPGFIGSKGNIFDVIFRVKDTGVADVTFSSGSILANDGKGSNLLSAFGSAVFSLVKSKPVTTPLPSVTTPSVTLPTPPVSPPSISSPTPLPLPQLKFFLQDSSGNDILFANSEEAPKWSNSSYAKITWILPDNETKVSMILDDNPDTEPDAKSETIADSQILPLLSEGKHYFHIRFIKDNTAGPVLHFPIFIDLYEPKQFGINFIDEESTSQGIHSTSSPKPRLAIFTEDILSGLDFYEYKINNGDWEKVQLENGGIFVLPKLEPKVRYNLTVRAFDLAGNFVDSSATLIIEPVVSPVITYYPRNVRSTSGTLVVEGESAPNAKIELILEKDEPIIISTQADQDGDWRIIYTGILPGGIYSVRARQILDNGAESLFTEALTIRIDSKLGKFLEWFETSAWYIVLLVFIISQVIALFFYRRSLKHFRSQMVQQSNLSDNHVSKNQADKEKIETTKLSN